MTRPAVHTILIYYFFNLILNYISIKRPRRLVVTVQQRVIVEIGLGFMNKQDQTVFTLYQEQF